VVTQQQAFLHKHVVFASASANAITQFLYKCYAQLQPVAIYGLYSDARHNVFACVLLHCVVLASLSFITIASTGGPPLQPQALQQPPRGPPPRGPPPGTTQHLNIVLCLTHVYMNERTTAHLLMAFPSIVCTCVFRSFAYCVSIHIIYHILLSCYQNRNCCRHVTSNGFTSGCTRTSPS
jgi:hypothetical protein